MINMVEALREAEAYKDHASRYMEYAVEHELYSQHYIYPWFVSPMIRFAVRGE